MNGVLYFHSENDKSLGELRFSSFPVGTKQRTISLVLAHNFPLLIAEHTFLYCEYVTTTGAVISLAPPEREKRSSCNVSVVITFPIHTRMETSGWILFGNNCSGVMQRRSRIKGSRLWTLWELFFGNIEKDWCFRFPRERINKSKTLNSNWKRRRETVRCE